MLELKFEDRDLGKKKTYGQLVDVDLHKVSGSELSRQVVEDRLHHLAGTAPGSREIDDNLLSSNFKPQEELQNPN